MDGLFYIFDGIGEFWRDFRANLSETKKEGDAKENNENEDYINNDLDDGEEEDEEEDEEEREREGLDAKERKDLEAIRTIDSNDNMVLPEQVISLFHILLK